MVLCSSILIDDRWTNIRGIFNWGEKKIYIYIISSQGVYPLRGWLDTVMLLYLGRIKVFPLLAAKLLANLMLWFFKYASVRTKMQKRLMCFELTVILTVEE